jgi:hypothetical protein
LIANRKPCLFEVAIAACRDEQSASREEQRTRNQLRTADEYASMMGGVSGQEAPQKPRKLLSTAPFHQCAGRRTMEPMDGSSTTRDGFTGERGDFDTSAGSLVTGGISSLPDQARRWLAGKARRSSCPLMG